MSVNESFGSKRELREQPWRRRFLFLDWAAPLCPDVADSNGDGEEDIGDALFLL